MSGSGGDSLTVKTGHPAFNPKGDDCREPAVASFDENMVGELSGKERLVGSQLTDRQGESGAHPTGPLRPIHETADLRPFLPPKPAIIHRPDQPVRLLPRESGPPTVLTPTANSH